MGDVTNANIYIANLNICKASVNLRGNGPIKLNYVRGEPNNWPKCIRYLLHIASLYAYRERACAISILINSFVVIDFEHIDELLAILCGAGI